MTDVNRALEANRDAVAEFIAAAERAGERWTVSPAPNKWSPSQIVEHVARALEESANMMSGRPTKFPKLPIFLRPVARGLVFRRVLRDGAFPRARTNKAMNPLNGSPTPAEARGRLEAALAQFDRECRACANGSQTIMSETFGVVPIADYARFIELHTRHHCRQMPTP